MFKAKKGVRLLRKLVAISAISVLMLTTSVFGDSRPDVSVAVNKLARSLDPVKHTGNVDVRIYYSIYDTLIRRDFLNPPAEGGASLIPGLATSWRRVTPKTIELTLRKNVKCHDGSVFNADDVLATFDKNRLWGKDAYYSKGRVYFGHLQSVEKVDDYTVRFNTKVTDLIFEHRLTSYTSFVICDSAWNKNKVEGGDHKKWMAKASKTFQWKPVGTGPYKFKSYRKNDHITIEAHDSYWEGKPGAKSIKFRAVPEVAARISGLVSGEYDMAVEIPPDQWDLFKQYDDIKLKSIVLDNSHVLTFNTKILKNKKLRHAMSLAIDRKKLIDSLWKGATYTPKGHQLESFGPMYQKGRQGYVYDIEKAKRLVKESGYNGEEISYRLIPNYYLNNIAAAQAIQEMWRQIGLNVKLEFVESFKKVRAKGAMVYAWSNTYRLPDPSGALMSTWGPEAAIQKKYKFFSPPAEFNQLGRDLFAMTDMQARSAAFGKMLDIFEDEMPMTILYNPIVTFAFKENISWDPYTLFFMDFRPSNFSIK